MLRGLLFFIATLLSGCASWFIPEATVPMREVAQTHVGSADAPKVLLIILPGRNSSPEQCIDEGMLAALAERPESIDILIPDAHLGYYYNKSITRRLHEDVLAPALAAKQYDEVWVAGISLGGLGALFMQRDYPGSFDRMVLIAPFLGESDALAESLATSESLAVWTPPANLDAEPHEIEVWELLSANARGEVDLGDIWLLYGEDDRYARLQKILAQNLPPDHVITAPGGHEWPVWIALWTEAIALPVQGGACCP